MSGQANLQLPAEVLKPLVQQTVTEVLPRLEDVHATLNGHRMAWSEHEAAGLLGLQSWQLRDERPRGRIQASVGPGRRIMYSRQNLTNYLLSRPWVPKEER